MTRIGQQRRRAAAWLTSLVPLSKATWAANVLPQLLALTASAILCGLGPGADVPSDTWVWAVLAVAFAGLRIATASADLVPSTYALDAVGVAVFIGGTGGASSPFFALALAGAWWAGQKAGRGTIYGLAFAAAYLVLVAPQAARAGEMGAVIYQPAFVCAIGLFVDRLRATANPVLTAGQLGLTAAQTELIPYLMLGLSNQEIADALSVSEATVRYRLTRLYRSLGVRGRKAAAERARKLGLGALVPSTAQNHP